VPNFTLLYRLFLLASSLLILNGCQTITPQPAINLPDNDPIADILNDKSSSSTSPVGMLKKIGFSVQVGAFSQMENAVRLEQQLKEKGVDAYHFLHESGFYKVRFGDYDLYSKAKVDAQRLTQQGLLKSFFIVIPSDYVVAQPRNDDHRLVRKELVSTVRRFLGVPYRWGGEDRHNGFDCSGLTMVSYRLNGLKLPRNSRAQFKAGRVVSKKHLRQGDLVFFATKGGTRVTHVGMYVGEGRFIHAPRPGKTVRIANLSNKFFQKTFVGARSYL
jgi:NlpC/P60 family/SPOR domain